MPEIDDLRIAERLDDVVRATARSVVTPAFDTTVKLARARRRAHGLAATAVAAAAVVGLVSLALQVDSSRIARTEPADEPTSGARELGDAPSAVAGRVSDLVRLPGGGLGLLYAACPDRAEVCLPHAYVSPNDGRHWRGRYDFDGIDQSRLVARADAWGMTSFDLSASGDVALLTDEEPPTTKTYAVRGTGGVLIDASGPETRVVGIADEIGPLSGRSIAEPGRAILSTRGGAFDVITVEARRPLRIASVTRLSSEDLPFAAAVDGILSAKGREEINVVSSDLGQTWREVPFPPARPTLCCSTRQVDCTESQKGTAPASGSSGSSEATRVKSGPRARTGPSGSVTQRQPSGRGSTYPSETTEI